MIPVSIPCLVLALLAAQEPTQRIPITAAPDASARTLAEGTELRLHDVAHLTGYTRLQDLIAGIVNTSDPVQVEGALARLERLERRRGEVRSTTDSLLSAIREMISPPLEDDLQRVDDVEGGRIALVGTGPQHDWLSGFLRAAAEFDGIIDLEARIFVLEKGKLAELSQARSGQVLGAAETAELLDRLAALGVETVTSPRLATFPFQEAQLSVLDQVAYIKDYEIKVLPEQEAEIADPIIDVVNSGVQMVLRGIPLADDKLGIFADLEYSALEKPIPTFTSTIGAGGHEVTIQLPQVTKVKLEGRFELRPGETLLLATVDPTGASEVMALLRASRIEAVRQADPSDR